MSFTGEMAGGQGQFPPLRLQPSDLGLQVSSSARVSPHLPSESTPNTGFSGEAVSPQKVHTRISEDARKSKNPDLKQPPTSAEGKSLETVDLTGASSDTSDGEMGVSALSVRSSIHHGLRCLESSMVALLHMLSLLPDCRGLNGTFQRVRSQQKS
jgi:hypothetical protein